MLAVMLKFLWQSWQTILSSLVAYGIIWWLSGRLHASPVMVGLALLCGLFYQACVHFSIRFAEYKDAIEKKLDDIRGATEQNGTYD